MVTGGGVYVELDGDTELSETVATGDCLYIQGCIHKPIPQRIHKWYPCLPKRWNECKES